MARLQLVSPMHPSECMPAGRRWEAAPVTAPYSVSAGCTIRRSGAALGAARAETPAKARDHERNLGRDYEVLGDGACSFIDRSKTPAYIMCRRGT